MSELKKYSFILPSTSLTAFSHEIDFKSILYLSSPSKGKLSIQVFRSEVVCHIELIHEKIFLGSSRISPQTCGISSRQKWLRLCLLLRVV